ncbi:MAG: trypco2 family protein [Acidobacteriota bacterium]
MNLRPRTLAPLLFGAALACSTSAPPPASEAPLLSPADLVASLADVANGRNADMAETGLVLKRIELKLAVARERRRDGRVSILVLDAGASRRTETSFTQTFTLELPPPSRRTAAATVAALPGVVDFVDAAMSSARELVAAAARAEIPQRLREVELVARIVRSDRVEGGIAFQVFTGASLSGGIARTADETNTVRLVFAAP